MWQLTPIAIAAVVDPRGLLPPREGSLILVLGGTAVLILSLSVALISGRAPLRRASPTPTVGPRPKPKGGPLEPAPSSPKPSSRLALHELLLMATARAGLGIPQIVTSTPGPHALVVLDCLDRRSTDPGEACGWRQEELERAVRLFAPSSQVVRISCGPEDARACIFEVRMGDVGT